jgi:flap endonuclease-1
MLGCDYTNSIKGVGPKRAIELIKNHRSLEKIIENIDTKKYSIPEEWNYKAARLLFQEPEISNADDVQVTFISHNFSLYKLHYLITNIVYICFYFIKLKWSEPDEEGLVKFLCGDKQFNEERVKNGAKKLHKARNTSTQGRLDSFFKVLPNSSPTPKRKVRSFSKKF